MERLKITKEITRQSEAGRRSLSASIYQRLKEKGIFTLVGGSLDDHDWREIEREISLSLPDKVEAFRNRGLNRIQFKVALLVAAGLRTKEVAAAMGFRYPQQVSNVKKRIKLKMSDRNEKTEQK